MPANQGILAALFLPSLVLATATGCLSLGGTTYTGNSPETEGRLNALEGRVSHLETLVHGQPATTVTASPASPY